MNEPNQQLVEAVARPFQLRVADWMRQCFTPKIIADKLERADRFIEEALELVQATGYSAERAHALVDYVFGRPVGDPSQEVGGVMVTLAALCNPHSLDMNGAAETELARIWTKIETIRAKQATKPVGSALPSPVATDGECQRRHFAVAAMQEVLEEIIMRDLLDGGLLLRARAAVGGDNG